MEFHEYLVKRRFGPAEKLVRVMLYVAAFFFMLCCIYYLRFLHGFENFVSVGGWWLAYILASRLKKEFEYVCFEDSVDIDIIFNGSKRKDMISFSLKDVDVIASFKDEQHKGRAKEHFDRVVDASTWREGANVYFAILEKDGKTIVKFEPPIECLEYMKQYAPKKVHIYKTEEDIDDDFE